MYLSIPYYVISLLITSQPARIIYCCCFRRKGS